MEQLPSAQKGMAIIKGIETAIKDGEDLFPQIMVDEGDELTTMAAAIARLKYMEVVLYKSCADTEGGYKALKALLRDVNGSMVIMGCMGGWLKREDVMGLWDNEELTAAFDKANAQDLKDPTADETFTAAISSVQEAFGKMGMNPI